MARICCIYIILSDVVVAVSLCTHKKPQDAHISVSGQPSQVRLNIELPPVVPSMSSHIRNGPEGAKDT